MADKRVIDLTEKSTVDNSDYLIVDSSTGGTKKLGMEYLLYATGGKATIQKATLAAGATTVTFTNIPTTGINTIEVYTSKAGLEYTAVDDTTAGSLVYTFEAQSSDVTVYLVIRDILTGSLPKWDSRGLEYNSWATIQAYINAGELSNVATVGETKSIVVNGNTYNMQLASINDGTGAAGEYYPNNTADFISIELMPDLKVMNSTNTNVGGWKDCELRNYLNSTVYANLPNDIKNVIVDKTHMHRLGDSSAAIESVSDKLWLPTSWECFGSNPSYGDLENQNKRYSILSTISGRKKTQIGQTSPESWWLSTADYDNSTIFASSAFSGGEAGYTANVELGVVLCVRIG